MPLYFSVIRYLLTFLSLLCWLLLLKYECSSFPQSFCSGILIWLQSILRKQDKCLSLFSLILLYFWWTECYSVGAWPLPQIHLTCDLSKQKLTPTWPCGNRTQYIPVFVVTCKKILIISFKVGWRKETRKENSQVGNMEIKIPVAILVSERISGEEENEQEFQILVPQTIKFFPCRWNKSLRSSSVFQQTPKSL